ncbi:MAG: TonB-dependent receptor, partial [Phycisphaerales bacterium]|nr:TonB-dependent receptor [Phycisphaerales bacterium]
LLTTLLSGAVIGSAAIPAFAADDEIIVTGSRIKKKDFVSNSPIATIDASQFQATGTVNTENLLNTLPQTVPGLDRTSNNPGNGSATVNLRGLGSNRTLVLVNGRRMVPFGQNGVVDLNTIPSSLISSVEVLTGGASSVYGSDAVAGVVNFIYKDDFEGVEANLGYSITGEGDAGLINADVTIGANFDEGRGNAVLNVSYANRDELFQGDRDFSAVAFFDDGAGGLEPGGSSGVPGTSIFSTFDFGGGVTGPGIFESNGTLRPFVLSGQVNDFYNYAPVNFLQLPQERFTITSLANYEINEHAEVYARGSFSSNKVDSELAPTPIFQTSTFTLDGNPFLNAASQQVISDTLGLGVDTDGDGIDDEARGFMRRRLVEVGPRQTKDDNLAFQITTGIRGAINDTWDYDVYIQEGRTLRSQVQNGNVNRGRYDQALLLTTDIAGNVVLDVNGNPTCADGSANGGLTGCAPMNIFGPGNISDEAADFIRTRANARSTFEQTVVAANFTGNLGEMKITDDEIGVAFGFEYIENEAAFDPSQDVAASTIAGFNGSPPSGGKFDVYSAYGELSVPLLEGKDYAKSVTLDLAGRVSDYSTSGTSYNYKVGGEWSVNDQLRFRGNHNTATRAPNIGELFAPIGENFPGAQDPCSSQNAPVSAAVAAICTATGVPAATVGSNTIDTISGQVQTLSGGNPNLDVETAKTITFGAVLTPASIEGLSLSIDYYDIVINDAISQFGGGANNVLNICYDPASAQGGAGSAFCNVITRRSDGSIDFISLQSQNVAQISVAGIDVSINYGFDTADMFGSDWGHIDLSYLGTYNMENDFIAFDGADTIECAGKFGVQCGTPDPTYRHRMVGSWSKGSVSAQTVWRLVGGVDDDDDLTVFTVDRIGAFNYFDSSVSWDANDSISITFGVNNVFDKKPPVIGDNDQQANTYPNRYDVFGRSFFANLKIRM